MPSDFHKSLLYSLQYNFVEIPWNLKHHVLLLNEFAFDRLGIKAIKSFCLNFQLNFTCSFNFVVVHLIQITVFIKCKCIFDVLKLCGFLSIVRANFIFFIWTILVSYANIFILILFILIHWNDSIYSAKGSEILII